MKRAEHVLEHLDAPVPRADREASLADVHRLNAWFGGYGLTLRAIGRVLRGRRASQALVVRADATALPLRDGAADVVTTALTLHHLEPDAAVRCLAEMRAVSRNAVIVNDLWRTRLTLVLVWIPTRLFTRHRFAWDDGPLSVRRSYSPAELRQLAEKAGITNLVVRRYPWLGRVIAVSA